MAQLFKNKALKAELAGYEVPDFENKLKIVQEWLEAHKSGVLKQKTESQCEQAFNQSFFVDILGYSTFPKEIYTLEPKGRTEAGGQKPDAVLGYFSPEIKRAVAVVEIKDAKTPLDKSQQREGNLSPIQQAFKYKPQFKECSFVIATNFIEIRLLRDNQLDYEHFTLEELASPDDNYFAFKKFYYLLNAENFVTKAGKTKTESILADIRIEEEQITKDFYKEYKKLRQELIKDIVSSNEVKREKFPKVVEQAQKIIDRVVFICFCEDLGLLPENKLQEVIGYAENSPLPQPIWHVMKGFFTAIDKGSDKLGIADGYNGELFKEDEGINTLHINDAICKKFAELGKYDFAEDLSVNILGHIFEQSISDIEELKCLGSVEEMQKQSKRKKDGIFYTPEYIVDYIVTHALGTYLEDIEKEVMAKHKLKADIKDENYEKRALKAYTEYQEKLQNVKVLDPACGSGAFLVRVFDYLLEENRRIGSILTELQGATDIFSHEDYVKSILQNNIYGVDLNPESVEITKLSLWLKSAKKGQKLVTLKGNIKCGNSLIDDKKIAGERAFKWEDEFKEIMDSGGFNVIVGNPPYVRVQNLKHEEIDWYKQNKRVAFKRVDISIMFFELSKKLLSKNGIVSFITSNQFQNAEYGQEIRKFLSEELQILQIVDFGDLPVFQDALTYVSIYTLANAYPQEFSYTKVNSLDDFRGKIVSDGVIIEPRALGGNSWILKSKNETSLLNKLNSFQKFAQIGNTWAGLFTGLDDVLMFDDSDDKLIESELLLPVIRANDVSRYAAVKASKKVIYPYEVVGNKTVPLKEKDIKEKFPRAYAYLMEHKSQLQKRKDSRKTFEDREDWYALTRFGRKDIFRQLKIVTPGEVKVHKFAISTDMAGFSCARVFAMTINDKSYMPEFVLGLLNSNLMKYFLRSIAPLKQGGYYTYSSGILNQAPIVDTQNQNPLVEKVQTIIGVNHQKHELYEKFITLIESEYPLFKSYQKIHSFYEQTFKDFLQSAKLTKLSLQKKEELMQLFDKYSMELKKLSDEIVSIDKQIDDMVFELYGLTNEEKALVMQSANA